MGQEVLSEYGWMKLWGTKTGPRRLAWAGAWTGRRKAPEKPKPTPPGVLHADIFSVEDLAECVPVTARPCLGLNRFW